MDEDVTMIRCSRCGHEEYPGALYCGECGAPLFSPGQTTQNLGGLEEQEQVWLTESYAPRPEPALQEARLVLQAVRAQRSLSFNREGVWVLGRRTSSTQGRVDIDLSPFDALPLGVSRVHAEVAVRPDGVFVTDLGSTNGTWVNGVRLQPHAPHLLRHGDMLALGKLIFQVFIPS